MDAEKKQARNQLLGELESLRQIFQQQQSTDKSDRPPPTATAENPFIPAEIRGRLYTRDPLHDAIRQATHPPSGCVTERQPMRDNIINSLIDEVIEEFLPDIEAELQRRLRQLLSDLPGEP